MTMSFELRYKIRSSLETAESEVREAARAALLLPDYTLLQKLCAIGNDLKIQLDIVRAEER